MHNIANPKVGGISYRNLKMLRKLIGKDKFCNIMIVTTMWDVIDRAVGEKREQELKSKDLFFKPLLEQKAQLFRHDSGLDSAERIVNTILKNNPRAGHIQAEPSKDRSRLVDTSTGVEFMAESERSELHSPSPPTPLQSDLNMYTASTDVLSWTNQDPRESQLFNLWGMLYRFQVCVFRAQRFYPKRYLHRRPFGQTGGVLRCSGARFVRTRKIASQSWSGLPQAALDAP